MPSKLMWLSEELRIAHQRLIVAERRCGELKRQLEHALRDEAQQPQRLAGQTWAEGDADPRAAKTAQQAAAALEKMNPTHAAGSLAAMAPAAAAAALSAMAPANAAAALQIMDPASSASVFGVMRTASALRYLDAMDPRRVPPVMDVMSPEPAAVILDALSREGAADALAAVSSEQAARLVGKMNPVRAVSPRADHLPQPCTGDALLQGCAQAHQVHSDGLAIAPVGVGGVLDRVRVHQVLDQRRRVVVGGQGCFPVLKPAIQLPASWGGVHVGVDRAGHIRDHRSAAGAPDFAHERTITALSVLPETDDSLAVVGLGHQPPVASRAAACAGRRLAD
jgi:flagellar motility protein MotE (MotC chaperone)